MATTPRKAHVKRVYRMDPDTQDIDKNVWLDLLRIDSATFQFRAQETGKITSTRFNLNWKDDPSKFSDGDKQQENANTSRKTEQIKVKNPDDDSQFIPLWIVDRAKIVSRGGLQPGDDRGATEQAVNFVFNNAPSDQDGSSKSRKVTAVKVVTNDLGGQDVLDMSKGPVDWDTYLNAYNNGKKDSGQKLYAEIPDSFVVHFAANALNGVVGQNIRYVENNGDIKKLFDLSDSDKTPVRTDPLQMIVNVGWRQLLIAAGVTWNDSGFNGISSLRVGTGTNVTTGTTPATYKTVIDITWATVSGIAASSISRSGGSAKIPKQDGIKWLNPNASIKTDVVGPPFAPIFTGFSPDITSVHWDSSVDGGTAPFTETTVWANVNPSGGDVQLFGYGIPLYIQMKFPDLSKETTDVGEININISGVGESMSEFGASVEGTWSMTFVDQGESTTDSATAGNTQALRGSPGAGFGASLYSTDNAIFDEASQVIKLKDPKKPSSLIAELLIDAVSVRPTGSDQIVPAISGPVTVNIAVKKIGSKNYAVPWIKSPGPASTDPLCGSYTWRAYNDQGILVGSASGIAFGTPP